jgi:hypothetical protein
VEDIELPSQNQLDPIWISNHDDRQLNTVREFCLDMTLLWMVGGITRANNNSIGCFPREYDLDQLYYASIDIDS